MHISFLTLLQIVHSVQQNFKQIISKLTLAVNDLQYPEFELKSNIILIGLL